MRSQLRLLAAAGIAAAALAALAVPSASASTVPPTEPAGTEPDSTEPAGTAPAATESSASPGTIPDPAACAEGLTLEEGVLTVATGEPAFPPYVIEDDPTTGEGFEAAVAYAVAAELGFEHDAVNWVRTTFDGAIQPGPKDFDFNLQQYSISEERLEVVSFSVPYYTSTQAVVAIAESPAVGAATLPDLQALRLGVAAGTTSLALIEDVIEPSADVQVFNTNADAVQALSTQQVDALVVDLPTALFLANVEIEGGVVVGQFPPIDAAPGEDWGLLMEQDNPLVECVDYALLRLRESGELAEITTTWMEEATEVPVFDLE
jgi:polar amino acid transport system substrate-binding protein